MPLVSKRHIDEATKKVIGNLLFYTFSKINSAQVRALMGALFTKMELFMLAKRLAAFHFIQRGSSVGEIADRLKLSEETVRKFKLQQGLVTKEAKDLVKKKVASYELQELGKKTLMELLSYAVRAAGGRIPTPKLP